jgi:Bacterial Ig domain
MSNGILRLAAVAAFALSFQSAHAAAACPRIAVDSSGALANGTVGTAYTPVTITANGSSATPYDFEITGGLPSTFGFSIDSAGSLSGTPTQAGDFTPTFTATDTDGCSGGRTFALHVDKGDQTLSFTSTAPTDAKVGGAAYSVTATSTSSLPVALTIDPASASVCSISGSSVSFQSVGTCTIDANQAGNANYNAATQVQQSFDVAIGDQTITFTSTAPASAVVGGPTYTVAATASSGLPVSFTIDASAASVCSISGSSVSFIGTGTCVIDADQAGNANYNAAPQTQQSFGVGKSNQTISFTSTAPTTATVGGATYTPTATATSGLAVALTIDAASVSVCSISLGVVSFNAIGTCVIDANQAGDASYNPAPQIQQSITVGKGNQTITFTSSASVDFKVGGPAYTVTATTTSGLPVTFTIDASASSVCSISGSTVSFIGAGTCVIDANQAGDANYNTAPQVQQTFPVGKGSQTITFTSTAPAAAAVGGATYTVAANSTSGLPVSFSIDASATSVCSISGSTVSFIGAGTCVVDADQSGSANWNAAPQAQQSFAVAKGTQTITFTSTPPVGARIGDPAYVVTATSSAGLTVTFSIDAAALAVCSISGSSVSFIGAGSCVIDANQAGNANYNAATQVQQSFVVSKKDQTISFTSTAPAGAKNAGPTYPVTATSTSSLAVTFSSATPTVCMVSGSTVSFVGAGTCTINADQSGNATFNAAPQVQQTFSVAKGDQTISFTSTAPAFGSAINTATPNTYNATATATSGLAVTITTSGACSNAGGTITFGPSAGTCSIFANQPGDANWNAAPQAQQSVTVEIPANAVADAHNVTGNVAIQTTGSVLTNDTGTSIAIRTFGATGTEKTPGNTATTVAGGSVTLNASGTYSYDPASNFTGTDSFNYIIGNDLAATSTGTVTLTVSDRIIVVSTTAGAAGCKPVTPTPCSLATADAAAPAAGKDLVFLQSGTYNSAVFSMNTNQVLAGNAVSLAQAIGDASITLAPDSVAIATIAANARPTLVNSATILTLSTGDLVEYFNINPSAGSAIVANGATSGTDTIHDVDVNGTGGASGVNLNANTGGTFSFSSFTVATVNGTAFSASGGGTVSVTAGALPNKLAATAATALNVSNTTIGAAGMTFLSIDSPNSAANAGIVMINSGGGSLTVTGSGTANSGGTIGNKTGGDVTVGSPAVPNGNSNGVGVFLNGTGSVSLTSVHLHDFSNFAILGSNVNGFTLASSVVDGVSGNNDAVDEDAISFFGLTGSAAFTNDTIGGGWEDNLHIQNSTGTLNRLTVDTVTFASNSASFGNEDMNIAVSGTGVLSMTVQNSKFTSSRSTYLQYSMNTGTPSGDVVINNNIFSAGQAQISGAAGIFITSGGVGSNPNLTYHVINNSLNGVLGSAINVSKGSGTGSYNGYIENNSIGTSGLAQSGSQQGSGIAFIHLGGGTNTTKIANNAIFQIAGNNGIQVQAGDNTSGGNGTVNATIVSNTIKQGVSFANAGFELNAGTTAGDAHTVCLALGGAGALRNDVAGFGGSEEVRLRSRFNATVRLPGYSGAATDTTAVSTYEASTNTTSAGAGSFVTNTSSSVGYLGGASCPLPTNAE